MKRSTLVAGPVTLYAQLASILRDRIVTGAWKSGEEIPTLEQLVEEFSVARITVRQAVQMLADEGLVSSQRGRRTFVTFAAPNGNAQPLVSYIGSADAEIANYSILVLGKQEVEAVPPQLAHLGTAQGKYVRIRKVDSQNGMPYAVSDSYIAANVYRRMPAHGELKMKLSRLVRDHAKPAVLTGTEWITVGTATYDEASQLQTPMGGAVARVTRAFITADGKLTYVGVFTYRGDRFAVERDISAALRPGSEVAARTQAGMAMAHPHTPSAARQRAASR